MQSRILYLKIPMVIKRKNVNRCFGILIKESNTPFILIYNKKKNCTPSSSKYKSRFFSNTLNK